MIRAVYIFAEGGVSLFSKVYNPNEADPFLMSSFISAISEFSKQAMGNRLSGIEADGRYIFNYHQEPITVVLLADRQSEVSISLLEQIALSFVSKYSDIIKNGDFNANRFQDFGRVLSNILPGTLMEVEPTEVIEPLDGVSIVSLPIGLQRMAKLILREKKLTPLRAAKGLCITKDAAAEQLEQLFQLKKVARQKTPNGTLYTI
ncbi:hypothetical protein EU537_12490 [Candidatus Thorarchaeota archaeon]|nr:MAG: hypothetical protein EU537_12490 [Candidatus Thorarchaeota archaeon]